MLFKITLIILERQRYLNSGSQIFFLKVERLGLEGLQISDNTEQKGQNLHSAFLSVQVSISSQQDQLFLVNPAIADQQ